MRCILVNDSCRRPDMYIKYENTCFYIYNYVNTVVVFFALCSTGHGMRYSLNKTTKVILLTAVVRDIGFENVTDMSLSES